MCVYQPYTLSQAVIYTNSHNSPIDNTVLETAVLIHIAKKFSELYENSQFITMFKIT
jgi:hypothetical protein